MATIGVKVELEGTKEFNAGMKNLKEQTKLFDTQLKNLDSTMKGQSAFAKAIKEHELLTQKMEALTKESELLQQRIQESTDKFGENDTRTLALKNQYEKLQGEIAKTNEALSNNNGFFTALGSELDEIGGKLQNVGDKITGVGENLTKNLTGPIVALGAASIAAFKDVDSGMDTIIKKTGASGQALEEMQGIAENIATTIPTSFDDVGNAVGEVNTRFGLTGSELETLSKQFIEFADLNGTDVTSSIDSVQSAMAAFGISAEDAGLFLDTLNKAGQDTGANVQQLASDMTSNAAVLKEFGFSASDSAMFMANLNKQGLDSSTVLAGMKKAMTNSIKEGKSMDEALAELEQTMLSSDSSTEAYQEALELFGNKAGPAIASAVKEGRLSFQKLDTTMSEFAGNVETTFEATIDPIDEFQTNLNKVKIAGSNLVKAANPMISQFFDKISRAIDSMTQKWNSLSTGQQQAIVKAGLMIAAIGPLVVAIGKITHAVGDLFTGVGSLIGFVAANPVLAGITVALGLVTVAAIALKEATDDVSDSVELQAQRLEEAKTSAENYNKQMDQFVQNNQGIVDSIDLQYQAEQNLVTELQSIVDENGNVKQGYEERAQVITNQLGEAFGIEIEMQGNVIQNYQDTLSLIDQVIEKKKAEALIAAGQQEYINALQDQKNKYEELKTAEENLSTETDRYNGLVDEATAALKRYDEETANGNYDAANDAYVAWEQLTNQAEEQKKAVDDATESYRLYAEQFYQNQAVIENYDNLQKALTDGTTNLDGAITQFTENLVTNAPIDYLRTQAEDAKTYYEELLEDFNSGEVAISESQLQAAQTNAEEAQKILTEAVEAYRTQGLAAGAGYGEGLSESNKNILATIDDVIGNALAEVAKIQETGSPAQKYIEQGEYAGQGYAKGLENSKDIIETAMGTITTLLNTFELNTGTTISTGLLSNETAVKTSMTNIITQLGLDFETIETTQGTFMDNIDTKNTETFTNIFDTVKEKMGNVLTEVTTDCTQIESDFTYLVNNSEQWGSDFIGNFEAGIVSRMQSLLETVKRMAEEIASYMHFSTPDQGPLKDADKWMPDFMKLLAQGIDTNKYLVENAVKGLSFDMAEMMGNPFDVDEIYKSVRAGASDATTELYLNGRELTRGLKELGVQFNG